MSATNRRTLLRAGAVGTVAGATTLLADTTVANAAGVGPWEFVAPGSSIQAAITAGARAIQLGAGTYTVTSPITPTRGCALRGVGQSTRIVAGAPMSEVIAIGNGGAIDGVYIGDLVCDANGKAGHGINLNIVGTTGNYRGEPDAMTRLDNLWVYATTRDGVIYQGSDTQATITSRVRVRQAGNIGFNVLAPDNVFIACDATTASGTGQHGFYVGSANCHFHASKAWYCRGYGWHIKGSRNSFMGCEAQDTKLHGWYIEYDKNTFNGCMADTAGMYDVGGTPRASDGFYVVPNNLTILTGCLAFDRKPAGKPAQQRYGFNIPTALKTNGLFIANIGWDNTAGTINLR